MFRASVPDEAEGLVDLLRSTPEIAVFDTMGSQLRELVETRNPGSTLSRRDLVRQIEGLLGGVAPIQYGVWVYYPWSRRLVHILDSAEFIELRTNRNRYKITAEEQAILATKKVGIVGQSVGQSVALTMVMERSLGEIRLADYDTLGLSNLNRLRSGLHNLGVPKVYITAREIAEIDPFITVKCYPDGVAHDTIDDFLLSGGRLDLLIDECDSIDIKVWLRHHARDHRIPVLMETSDRCLVDIERFDLDPHRPIFHNLVGDLHPEQLGGLSNFDKVPYVLRIIGQETISNRARASMMEVSHSIKTWPQLASAVTMGGGIAADVARRMNLGYIRESGRFWVDIEQIIPDHAAPKHEPPPPPVPRAPAPPMPGAESMIELVRGLAPASPQAISLTEEQRGRILTAAVAAPSGGNSQPWRWLDDGTRLHLFQDHDRSAALADFRGCGAVVALGAAAENLVLAAHRERLEVATAVYPAGSDGPVATFEFFAEANDRSELHWHDERAAAIGERHTNRKTSRQPLDTAVVKELMAAVQSVPGAELQLLEEEPHILAIGKLIGAADRLRFLNEDCNRELYSELRFTPEEAQATRDGIAVETLELTRTDRSGLEICRSLPTMRLVRAWGGGQGLTTASRDAVIASSAIGLITMPNSQRSDYFLGGRALERMWLTAHVRGLAIHPMTTLTYLFARVLRGQGEGLDQATIDDVRRLRPAYRRLFTVDDDTAEIVLFRVSRADPTSARSLRRNVDEVLVVAPR